jgi:hypothetical protein
MCDFLRMPVNPALPSSPALLPTLGEGSQNYFQLPPLPDLGEEGWGGEGEIVAHRVSLGNLTRQGRSCNLKLDDAMRKSRLRSLILFFDRGAGVYAGLNVLLSS